MPRDVRSIGKGRRIFLKCYKLQDSICCLVARHTSICGYYVGKASLLLHFLCLKDRKL